jgi:hypothetical protein
MLKLRFFLLFTCISIALNAQGRKIKQPVKPIVTRPQVSNLGIGGGFTRSPLFLSRNFKDDNEAVGFNVGLVYDINRKFRISADLISYNKIDIKPTWYGIKAYTYDANLHMLFKMAGAKAYFYPIFGVSYNIFGGYFTGKNDYQNLSSRYKGNSHVKANWFGVNTGQPCKSKLVWRKYRHWV